MRNFQASETIKLGIILSLSGGFMDAYSYLGRGQVFANAQTGNLLLLGVNIANGNFNLVWRYLTPVLAFILGVLLSLIAKSLIKTRFHWRQLVLVLELTCFLIVAFIPATHNMIANSLISLACGMQVEAFRKIWGHPVATTMCIGNMKTGTENLYYYFTSKNKANLERALISFLVILVFILGAIGGDIALKYFGLHAILICPCLLLIGIILMIFNKEAALNREKTN